MAAKERQQGRGEGLPNVENLLVIIRRVGRGEGGWKELYATARESVVSRLFDCLRQLSWP